MGRLLNISFTYLGDEHIEMMGEMGIIDETIVVPNQKTFLPMIRDSSTSEQCKSDVKSAIDSCNPDESDVVMITGIPDVAYYVIEMCKEKGCTKVYMPVGRMRNGKFQLSSFRQVLV